MKKSTKVLRIPDPSINIEEAEREAQREAERRNAIANFIRSVVRNIRDRQGFCFQDLEFGELTSDDRDLVYRHLQDVTVQTDLFTINFRGTGYHVDYRDRVVSYLQFTNCKRLESITFEEDTVVEENSFKECSNLAKVIFEKGATVEIYGFYKCTGLKYLKFQKKCTIEDSAFEGCDQLSIVYFNRMKETTFGKHAFGFWNMQKKFEYSGDMPQTTPPAKRQRRLRL